MIRITDNFGPSNRNFGNKLFTYAVARIFSKELNQNLSIPKDSHIKRGGDIMNFPYGDVNGLNDYEDEVYVSDHTMIEKGFDIILFTAKVKPDRPLVNGKTGSELIWDWLSKYKIDKYVKEVTCEKPRALCYIDDKAIEFKSWDEVIDKLNNFF